MRPLVDDEGQEEPDHCGHDGEELVRDPFIFEIHNETVLRWLCPACQDERRDEI